MALELEKQLLITFDTILANGIGISAQLSQFDNVEKKDAVLQAIHDFLLEDSDQVYVKDGRFKRHIARQLQLKAGLHIASLNADTSAGTGSVSSQTIDSFSQSNTMAKNNADSDDWWNMTQYGTAYLTLIRANSGEGSIMI